MPKLLISDNSCFSLSRLLYSDLLLYYNLTMLLLFDLISYLWLLSELTSFPWLRRLFFDLNLLIIARLHLSKTDKEKLVISQATYRWP